jgi:branched-chain amino acid transport system ATP-binding protein
MENVVLHVDDVHKSFGGLHALSDIDLQVEEGKTHAIIGRTAPESRRFSTSASAALRRIPARSCSTARC